MISTSEALIQARWLLSISTSYHLEAMLSEWEETESIICIFVPSCRSMASSVRFFGALGDVLRIVEGTVTIA